MKDSVSTVVSSRMITPDVFELIVHTDLAKEAGAGQFVNIKVDHGFLRRPVSISRIGNDQLTFLIKIIGEGTKELSRRKAGDSIDLFGPLGNGFPEVNEPVILIGGGIGIAPLIEEAKVLKNKNLEVTAVLGFNTESDVFAVEEFQELGCEVSVSTMDGSYGTAGTVIDAIKETGIENRYVIACGPLPMLKAVSANYQRGCVSLEARMACGIGACMGCVVKSPDGEALRVCKDGPVFEIGKVVIE